ncbi:MAG: 50S ribosomal protein L5 [Victivallales bacterium]|nr:50S ribosomal protein L5 [Victivallales bacterium]
MPDIKNEYKDKIVASLKVKLGCENVMQVPRLTKIVISTGIGTAKEKDTFNDARDQIMLICGQRPVTVKSRKNVANFKLRAGTPVGLMVTLRGNRMYEFLDRLVNVALPRVRDFRGISPKGFDGAGNYNVGLDDLSIFTEIDLDKVKYQIGINIAFVTSARKNEEAFELLKELRLPFAS